jgi:hypothetical protein
MERQSDVVKEKLSTITEILCNIAISFEANGADFLWIAEPTGVLVSPSYFRKFITPYLQQIFDRVSIPGFLHMPGDTNHLLGEMMTVGAQCLSLDSMVNFRELAYRLPPDICIRGNINSKALLYESKNEIIQKVSSLNRSIKNFPQFIIGSGGGLAAETPELNIKAIQEETDKHAWYTNKQYQEIDTLWKILAQADRLETVVSIKKYGENTSILLNAFEEACNFLNYQFKNRKIDEKFYIQRLEYMAKLLEHIHFTSTDTIEIDNTTINLVQFQEATLKTFFRDT